MCARLESRAVIAGWPPVCKDHGASVWKERLFSLIRLLISTVVSGGAPFARSSHLYSPPAPGWLLNRASFQIKLVRSTSLTTRRGGHLELLTHLSVLLAEKPTCSCVKLHNVEHVVVNLSLQTPCPFTCASSRPHPHDPHTNRRHTRVDQSGFRDVRGACKQHSPLAPAQFFC